MATNLQVNANTQQAVGAFNALANSIATARGQFLALNVATQQLVTSNRQFSLALTQGVGSAFSKLTSLTSGFFDVLTKVGLGVQLVFTSLIRELDKIQGFNAIMSVTTKSSEAAASSYDFLRKTADRLGVQFDSLSGNYAKLVAAIPEGADRLRIAEKAFMGVAMAARTLHSTNQDTQLMFYAITQIASKGIVSMEELRRQLGEKLPGVIQIAAKALNTIPEELEKAIKKGTVISEKFLPILGDALIRTFGDSSEKASQSVSAAINRLTNVWVDFVKEVLDSGAGNSVIGIFDALREKLSDPYLISRFAELIRNLADRFSKFISGLTAEDIRNGFDTFANGVEMGIKLIEKLIQGLTWVINNASKAGAVVGAVGGAMVGSAAGPYGAAAGALIGAATGSYAGNAIAPTANQELARSSSSDLASYQKETKARERELLKFNELIPLLQQFKGLNNLSGMDKLFEAERLNTKTLQDLNTILKSPDFKTDKDRANAAKDYAKYGTILGSQNSTLKDVTGKGDGKKTAAQRAAEAEQRRLNATESRGMGLNASFFDEWNRLDKLMSQNRITTGQLTEARTRLLDKQPIMIESVKAEHQATLANNKALQANIDAAFRQVEVKESLRESMDQELKMAGIMQENMFVEGGLLQIQQTYKENDIRLTREQIQVYRDKLQLTKATQENTQAAETVKGQFGDKYGAARRQVGGIEGAMENGDISKQQATDFVVSQDPNMQGSQQWMDAQKRSLEEYYVFIADLRKRDLIDDQTAAQAKAQASLQYDQIKLQQTSSMFSNLASLSSSGNKKLAAIGKAAAVTSATIDGVMAVQKALAAPPGWPYNAPNVISVGIMQAANVAKIAGFEGGGYTGNVGRRTVAGVVHGNEFVVHANATARNRAALEAMNEGRDVSGTPRVAIYNYGTSKQFDVQITRDEIRVIARDEASSVVAQEAPRAVAAELTNPNSEVSRSLTQNTSVERRR